VGQHSLSLTLTAGPRTHRGGATVSVILYLFGLGGTGKYKGITGTVPYTVVVLHETVGGREAFIVNHKATWEIK
jgi:hypothetical protein